MVEIIKYCLICEKETKFKEIKDSLYSHKCMSCKRSYIKGTSK